MAIVSTRFLHAIPSYCSAVLFGELFPISLPRLYHALVASPIKICSIVWFVGALDAVNNSTLIILKSKLLPTCGRTWRGIAQSQLQLVLGTAGHQRNQRPLLTVTASCLKANATLHNLHTPSRSTESPIELSRHIRYGMQTRTQRSEE